ncbi:hypothetical protein BVRB_2g028340 isoform B [Beta vulgaris subsp. vulgaris]|nr:hypothetical protein BVRB_2g028340 isoform B [Beta vulgaris subsp. vulgaris]
MCIMYGLSVEDLDMLVAWSNQSLFNNVNLTSCLFFHPLGCTIPREDCSSTEICERPVGTIAYLGRAENLMQFRCSVQKGEEKLANCSAG